MLKLLLILFTLFISNIGLAQGTVKAYVTLNPAGDFVGTLKATGSATLIGGKVSAKNIVVDMKTLTTGLDLRDDHAKNKYMEVSKYPEAVLIDATGENGKGQGKIKYRGKEVPVTGTYTVQGGKNLQAEFKVKLSALGISDISYKGIGVEDDIKIEVQVPITAAGAAAPAAAAGAAGTGKPIPKPAPTKPLKK